MQVPRESNWRADRLGPRKSGRSPTQASRLSDISECCRNMCGRRAAIGQKAEQLRNAVSYSTKRESSKRTEALRWFWSWLTRRLPRESRSLFPSQRLASDRGQKATGRPSSFTIWWVTSHGSNLNTRTPKATWPERSARQLERI